MARNRIIYASQSVWANGELLYRVQSLGTTTTFTSEDIFELGHLDIIDVVDDVPAVAVTINTNDFGDVRTLAILAQVAPAKSAMQETAVVGNANLVAGSDYLHGVALADFAVTCGNLTGITMWAPVQAECSIGTLANEIDQTLFLDEVYVNSLEFAYTTGANATENYGAETDNKMWLLNAGRFVNYFSAVTSGTYQTLGSVGNIPTLSTGNLAFLRKDTNGSPAVTFYDKSENTMTNVAIVAGTEQVPNTFAYDASTDFIYYPLSGLTVAADDTIQVIYAADAYTPATNVYFNTLVSGTERPYEVGALRQGQVEVYIVDTADTVYDNAWRLTGCTISADLTREPLTELGHLGPYDRPLTLPIPITATVESTAGDLENWAKFAGQLSGYDGGTLKDIDLNDLMNKDDLTLVVKVFEQTDEEAGGTGSARKALTLYTAAAGGKKYFEDGDLATYASTIDRERALKTIVVKHLKITDEAMTLDVGANATQSFGFRSTNDLFVIKGDVSVANALAVTRNI